MTVKQWAEKLNGREYREEVSGEEQKQMADDGVIAAYGASDNLLEFRGALYDEYSAWEGAEAKLFKNNNGMVELYCDDRNDNFRGDQLLLTAAQIVKMLIIKATWAPNELPDTSWLIETSIPHEHFDIMEDGALYCRGIVFHMNDVPAV